MYKDPAFDMYAGLDDFHPEGTARALDATFPRLTAVERLRRLAQMAPGRLTHTTSFGLEGQALVHLIVEAGIRAEFVTLDTGRLFPETYDVWAETEARYGIRIRVCYPDASAVEELVADQGVNGFRDSVDARRACCAVRKLSPLIPAGIDVDPCTTGMPAGISLISRAAAPPTPRAYQSASTPTGMSRALTGAAAWITGLRADQSVHRASMQFAAYEAHRDIIKVNPLLDWNRDKVAALVAEQSIPVNPLHAQGYVSIGCAPCTRAIRPGEPERARRWWWEDGGNQECGLQLAADGRLVRRDAA